MTRVINTAPHELGIPNLVHVSDDQPGWTRRRHGRGFRFFQADGSPIHDNTIKRRLKTLAIPPAWTHVWICPLENGYLLCTGRDAAGRKQYRYHPDWLAYQQRTKFDQLIKFAEKLPSARKALREILTNPSRGWDRRRVTALALALMDETGMRVGNSSYRRNHGTIGLTTLRRKHLETEANGLHFEYLGKSGVEREVNLEDPLLVQLIQNVSELPGYEIFRYRGEDGRMHNVDSTDVNELVHELIGHQFSSKYFRTWAGTAAAVRMYWQIQTEKATKELPERMDLRVIERTAAFLGNTAAVCRKYYIHPSVLAAIEKRKLPGPESVKPQEEASFLGEFDAEEIIAYRVHSAGE